MKNLRKRFEIFCFRHRNWGIPNLMLYICLGTALVYVMRLTDKNQLLYFLLCFDRTSILNGQLWRLFTFPFVYGTDNLILTAISLVCYYSLGRAIENVWGTLRFNLFYLTGIVLMDIYCMIFGGMASAGYLNMSLFLAYATMYPDAHFLFLYIIPVKAWVFAIVDLGLTLLNVITLPFPINMFPVVALLNYFLFFGKDVLNVIPISWRANFRRLFRKKNYAPKTAQAKRSGPIIFPTAGSYEASVAAPKAPYTHRCTVCGRTDLSNPELEFRYCSRCSGYHCYCQDHISNHSHIE